MKRFESFNEKKTSELELEKKLEEKYGKPAYAIQQLLRATGIVENICKHGVGHPNKKFLKTKKLEKTVWAVHGCDGCCQEDWDEK